MASKRIDPNDLEDPDAANQLLRLVAEGTSLSDLVDVKAT